MFHKALIAVAVLALSGCWQNVHTGDITKAIYVCGGVQQVEYLSENVFGDTHAKCLSRKGTVNTDLVILTGQ